MKIVHICLSGIFTEGFTYQDNLLSKYHVKLGYDVTMITSDFVYDQKGKLGKTADFDYINEDGVHVIRLKEKNDKDFSKKIKHYPELCKKLSEEKPDIVFIHGINSYDNLILAKYFKNHRDIKVFVDNHCDYENSAQNFISKYILHRIIWRYVAWKLKPYVTKFWGVLPKRVDFIVENYKIPKEQCDLLVMGADDELVQSSSINTVKENTRKKFSIRNNDFLIVTGGKIDSNKKQTLLLMKSVQKLQSEKVKLLVFGSVSDDLKQEFEQLCEDKKIQYVGWADSIESAVYFSMADLAVFPGLHSVFWEEVVALGTPLVCKYLDGMEHIDIGGNVKYIKEDTVEEIQALLESIINTSIYQEMKKAATSNKKDNFLYSKIAKKSIE